MKKTVYIKKDINLLFRKEGPSPLYRYGIPLVILTLCLVVVFGVGIIIPHNIRADKIYEKNELVKQIESLSYVQSEFDSLNKEAAVINNRIKRFNDFTSEKKVLIKMLNIVEQACPDSIELNEAIFDYEKIMISGVCTSDEEVASFVVKLRMSGLIAETNIDTVEFNRGNFVKPRSFELLLYYPIEKPDVEAKADSDSSNLKTEKGGSQ
jgi:hypothetical protein